jgi:hypothetical protein
VGLRDVASERQQQGDRVLGCGVDRRLGGVRDDDPAARCGVDVDVVHADPGSPDDLETLCALDESGVERRGGANHDRVELADDLLQVGLRVLHHVESVVQERKAGGSDGLTNEDPRAVSASRRRYGHVSPARTEQAEDAGSPDIGSYRGD